MRKHLENDRELSEMRNAGSPLEVMLEQAFALGVKSAYAEMAEPKKEAAHPMQDWMDSTAPAPQSETAKAFAEAVAKRAEARKKG